jgi:hypothetical protein
MKFESIIFHLIFSKDELLAIWLVEKRRREDYA